MVCLTCSRAPTIGGMRYGVASAVAMCRTCGAGVCPRHLARGANNGGCLCPECADRLESTGSKSARRAGSTH